MDYTKASTEFLKTLKPTNVAKAYAPLMERVDSTTRMDDSSTAILNEQLEQLLPDIFNVEYDTLRAKEFMTVVSDVDRGAEAYTYRMIDDFGRAQLGRNHSDERLRIDFTMAEFKNPVHSVEAFYAWTVEDLWKATFAGVPLEREKVRAARTAMDREIDDIISVGRSTIGLEGFLNNSNVPVTVLPNGGWALPATTAEQIVEDLNALENAITVATNDVRAATTIIVPPSLMGVISQKFISGTSVSAKQAFLNNAQSVTSIEKWQKLGTAGPGGTPMVMCYQRDPGVVRATVPLPYFEMPPEARNFEFLVNVLARTGSAVFIRPLAATYTFDA